jgi:hypothetical protein
MDTLIYDDVLNVIYYFISILGLKYFAKYRCQNNFFLLMAVMLERSNA